MPDTGTVPELWSAGSNLMLSRKVRENLLSFDKNNRRPRSPLRQTRVTPG
jgi:hypothetical protein